MTRCTLMHILNEAEMSCRELRDEAARGVVLHVHQSPLLGFREAHPVTVPVHGLVNAARVDGSGPAADKLRAALEALQVPAEVNEEAGK